MRALVRNKPLLYLMHCFVLHILKMKRGCVFCVGGVRACEMLSFVIVISAGLGHFSSFTSKVEFVSVCVVYAWRRGDAGSCSISLRIFLLSNTFSP